MPQFSIVLPTLRRPDTLEHSLQTALRQPRDDVEIVVQNNGDDADSRRLVEGLGDARARHFATDSVLAMGDNWERALGNSRGEWVTFVGDDDGLLPDACAVLANLGGLDDYELLTWTPPMYLWPEYQDSRRRNRLEARVEFDPVATRVRSPAFLERFYRFDEHFSRLPMIYNSFVRRSLIERVVERHGRYFLGSVPDITSGIVNAAACDVFVRLTRPLSVWGVSHHSTGHKWARPGVRLGGEELGRDFPLLAGDNDEFPAWNFELVIAGEMERMRLAVLDGDERFALDPKRLARHVASAINNRPDQYEDTLRVLETMMAAHDIPRDDVPVPPRLEEPPVAPLGVTPLGPSSVRFVIDGDAIGLATIDDAVRLASQLFPSAARVAWQDEEAAVPIVSTEPLSFTSGGGGRHALVDGWSDAESWGTWAVGRESTMRFAVAANGRDTDAQMLRLGLKYRVIAAPGAEPLVVECTPPGGAPQRWTLGGANHQGQLTIDLPAPPDGEPVELTFVSANPRSPAELGVGPDHRQLGIGVEELRILGTADPRPRSRPRFRLRR
jgi:hypothetical protein